MRYKGFTKIPHYLLETPCGMSLAERVVLNAIYRLTAGYSRQSYRIKYSQLKEMTGVAGICRVILSLADKKRIALSDYKRGGSYIITIPLPITSVKHSGNMSSTPPSHDVNTSRSTDVNGSRRPIENIIDNYIDNSIEYTLTIDSALIEEMKMKYPDKDIEKAKKSFLNYPQHQGKCWSDVEVADRFRKWCATESVSPKMFIAQFKLDGGGANYVGYCAKCGVSDFYEGNTLMGDSRCCNAKILSSKIVPNI